MRRVVFTVELLTQSQHSDSLSLLNFPSGGIGPLFPIEADLKVTTERGGRALTRTYKNMKTFIRRAASERMQEVYVQFRLPPHTPAGQRFSVVDFEQFLEISPTSELWLPTEDWPQPMGPLIHRKYMTGRSWERSLRWNQVERLPNCLTSFFHIMGDAEPTVVLEWFRGAIMESLAALPLPGDVFGSAGFNSQVDDFPGVPGALAILHRWPGTYPLLGPRIACLTSLIIGPVDLCRGLVQSLGDGVEMALVSRQYSEPRGMAYVPPGVLNDPESERRAAEWLVPRDETTAVRRTR